MQNLLGDDDSIQYTHCGHKLRCLLVNRTNTSSLIITEMDIPEPKQTYFLSRSVRKIHGRRIDHQPVKGRILE